MITLCALLLVVMVVVVSIIVIMAGILAAMTGLITFLPMVLMVGTFLVIDVVFFALIRKLFNKDEK